MKFNITYCGPEFLHNLRRDFILYLKYSLEDLGHAVDLSVNQIDTSATNLIIGAYFLKPVDTQNIMNSGARYININTEIISNDMLNFNPEKTDFMNMYLPFMKSGISIIDLVSCNMAEHARYNNNVSLLRMGFHEKLQDIEHKKEKDLDFYLFGFLSNRRKLIVNELWQNGFSGMADHTCPYFIRNDKIGRAKVLLNIKQEDIYSHVNSFRIFYLLTNNCSVLSEPEIDEPDHYMPYVTVAEKDNLVDTMRELVSNNKYQETADAQHEEFKKIKAKDCMEQVLDSCFSAA